MPDFTITLKRTVEETVPVNIVAASQADAEYIGDLIMMNLSVGSHEDVARVLKDYFHGAKSVEQLDWELENEDYEVEDVTEDEDAAFDQCEDFIPSDESYSGDNNDG